MKLITINKYFLIAGLIVTLFNGCSSNSDQKEDSGSEGSRVEPVRTISLETTKISRNVTYTAALLPDKEVHLSSASPGRINRVFAETGQKVNRGDILVEMDLTQLHQAKLQLQSIQKDFNRIDTLRRAGSVSEQQYDQIKTQFELANSNVEFLEDNTKLFAPFSGIISGKYFENGEMFSGAPNTAVGKAAILSLVDISILKAKINVSERYLPFITTGMVVEVKTDVYPEQVFNGKVSLIYPAIDVATRTFTVEFTLPDQEGVLRPGMYARASLNLHEEEVFVVPALAVLKLQGSNERFVFIEKEGVAHRVVVIMGERFDDMVEIISDDIKEGVNLIIAGQSRLLDGVSVSVY